MGDTKIAKDGITYIAHRGNTEGPSGMENHPDHIAKALDQGYDVEVDVRIIDGEMFLGHDKPQYEVSQNIRQYILYQRSHPLTLLSNKVIFVAQYNKCIALILATIAITC